MKTTLNYIGTGLDALGIAVGASNIESVLNIILLVLSVASILWRLGMAIYDKIKQKKFDEVDDAIDKAIEEIKDIDKKGKDKDD